MGRNRTTIPFNVEAFKKYVKESSSFSERAKEFGVSKQAMNSWFSTGRIPPRALAEIAIDLNFTADVMTEILSVKSNKAHASLTKKIKYSIEIYEHVEDNEE